MPEGKGDFAGALVRGIPTWRAWDDLSFPATSVNPPGLASDPDWDSVNGGWLFDATSTELLYTIGEMPHAWFEGGVINPHVHWQKTTAAAGNVMWRFSYRMAPIGEVWDASFTNIDVSEESSLTPDDDTADRHLLTEFGPIDMTGYKMSHTLVMKVARIGGDAADTYAADARLLEFDIHYQIDYWGSEVEFEKNV